MEPVQSNPEVKEIQYDIYDASFDGLQFLAPTEGWEQHPELRQYFTQYKFTPTTLAKSGGYDPVELVVVHVKIEKGYTLEGYINHYEENIKKSGVDAKMGLEHKTLTKEEEEKGDREYAHWKITYKEADLMMYREVYVFIKDSHRYQVSVRCEISLKDQYQGVAKIVFDSIKIVEQSGMVFAGLTNHSYLLNLADRNDVRAPYNTLFTYYLPKDVYWEIKKDDDKCVALHNTIEGLGMHLEIINAGRMTPDMIIEDRKHIMLPNSRVWRMGDPKSLSYLTQPFYYNLQCWNEKYDNGVDIVEIHHNEKEKGTCIEMYLLLQQRTFHFSFCTSPGQFFNYKDLFQSFLNYIKLTDVDAKLEVMPLHITHLHVYNDVYHGFSILGPVALEYVIKGNHTLSISGKETRISVTCAPINKESRPVSEAKFSATLRNEFFLIGQSEGVSNFQLVQKSDTRIFNYKATLTVALFNDDHDRSKQYHLMAKSAVIAQKYTVRIFITTSNPFVAQNAEVIFDSFRLSHPY